MTPAPTCRWQRGSAPRAWGLGPGGLGAWGPGGLGHGMSQGPRACLCHSEYSHSKHSAPVCAFLQSTVDQAMVSMSRTWQCMGCRDLVVLCGAATAAVPRHVWLVLFPGLQGIAVSASLHLGTLPAPLSYTAATPPRCDLLCLGCSQLTAWPCYTCHRRPERAEVSQMQDEVKPRSTSHHLHPRFIERPLQ